jgi:hypothetical protein
MPREENAICDQIPHLRVRIIEVLLHAQDSFTRLVLPEFHVFELLERLFDWSSTMYARNPRTAIVSTSMSMDFLPYARMRQEAKEISRDTPVQ